jgi:hypothetical protein
MSKQTTESMIKPNKENFTTTGTTTDHIIISESKLFGFNAWTTSELYQQGLARLK